MMRLGCIRSWLRSRRGGKEGVDDDEDCDAEEYFALRQLRIQRKLEHARAENEKRWVDLKKAVISDLIVPSSGAPCGSSSSSSATSSSTSSRQTHLLPALTDAVDARELRRTSQILSELHRPELLQEVQTAEGRVAVWTRIDASVKMIRDAFEEGLPGFDAWAAVEPWIKFGEDKLLAAGVAGTAHAKRGVAGAPANPNAKVDHPYPPPPSNANSERKLRWRLDRLLNLEVGGEEVDVEPSSSSEAGGQAKAKRPGNVPSVRLSSTKTTSTLLLNGHEENARPSSSASRRRASSRNKTSPALDEEKTSAKNANKGEKRGAGDRSRSRDAWKKASPKDVDLESSNGTNFIQDDDDDDEDDVPYTARSNRSNVYEVLENEKRFQGRRGPEASGTPRRMRPDIHSAAGPPLPKLPTPRHSKTNEPEKPPQGPRPAQQQQQQAQKPPGEAPPSAAARPFSARSIRIAEALGTNPHPDVDKSKSKKQRPQSAGLFAFRRFLPATGASRAAAEEQLGPGQSYADAPPPDDNAAASPPPADKYPNPQRRPAKPPPAPDHLKEGRSAVFSGRPPKDPRSSAAGGQQAPSSASYSSNLPHHGKHGEHFAGAATPFAFKQNGASGAGATSSDRRRSSPVLSSPSPEDADEVGGGGGAASSPDVPHQQDATSGKNKSKQSPAGGGSSEARSRSAGAGRAYYYHRDFYTSSTEAGGTTGADEESCGRSGSEAGGVRGTATDSRSSKQNKFENVVASAAAQAPAGRPPTGMKPPQGPAHSTPRMSTPSGPSSAGPSPETPTYSPTSDERTNAKEYRREDHRHEHYTSPRTCQTPREHPRDVAARMFASRDGVRSERPGSARPPASDNDTPQKPQNPQAAQQPGAPSASSSSSRPGSSQQSYRASAQRDYVASEYDQYYHQRSSQYQEQMRRARAQSANNFRGSRQHQQHGESSSSSSAGAEHQPQPRPSSSGGYRREYTGNKNPEYYYHSYGQNPPGPDGGAPPNNQKQYNEHVPRFAQQQMPAGGGGPRAPDSARSGGGSGGGNSARSQHHPSFGDANMPAWFRHEFDRAQEQRREEYMREQRAQAERARKANAERERHRYEEAETARRAREKYFEEQRKRAEQDREREREREQQRRPSSSSARKNCMTGAERQQALRFLGLDASRLPSADDLKQAYRRKAKEFHPDRPHNHGEKQALAGEMFKKAKEAYDRLLADNSEQEAYAKPPPQRSYSMNPNRGNQGFRI
mmetsp:Transcript_25924/g.65336  ORF Transcript_25924/g.65336 Transcript_25924/m.65336 type:complete len:1233 (+) Transcript_25924:213-3911(+)